MEEEEEGKGEEGDKEEAEEEESKVSTGESGERMGGKDV